MKKHISILTALLLCLCIVLTACGGKESGTAPSDPENPAPEPTAEATPEPQVQLAGKWIYNYYNIFLNFNEDGSVEYETPKQEGSLSYSLDDSGLQIKDGDRLIGSGFINEDGNIQFKDLSGCFYPQGSSAYVPMSGADKVLLETNCEIGEKRTPLSNAAVFFNVNEDFYYPVDTYWTVVCGEPEISDGFKTMSAAAACFIPMANVPPMSFPNHYNCGVYLFDKYTGLILSTADFFELDENDFFHAFDSKDGRVELSFHREFEQSGKYGDSFDIMGFTYTFRFPEWYDGLMLAAAPRPDNIDELMELQNDPEDPLGLMILPYTNGRAESGLRYNIT